MFRVVISRRQPYPQKPRIPENPAAKFMQPQIAHGTAGTNHRRRRRCPVPFIHFLVFFHRKTVCAGLVVALERARLQPRLNSLLQNRFPPLLFAAPPLPTSPNTPTPP